jgi:hypothetical protein
MWTNTHTADCPVSRARRAVETDDTLTGSVRDGVIAELDAGGDDEAENCSCGHAVAS